MSAPDTESLSKKGGHLYSVRMRAFINDQHLSGGEDLVSRNALGERVLSLLEQGLTSSKNSDSLAPSLNIRIEPVPETDIVPSVLLPVYCLESGSHEDTLSFLRNALDTGFARLSVPGKMLFGHFLDILGGSGQKLSGASFILPSGQRVTPEKTGVRVSHFGIIPHLRQILLKEAATHPAGSGRRFIEALQIASKIMSHPVPEIEVCVSDNPDYTTGYLALKGFGYIRLPHIKPEGQEWGGRLIGLSSEIPPSLLSELSFYLSRVPVLFVDRSPLFPSENAIALLERLKKG
jgi:6-carboxyhexanoate--CoA ligase|uniref:6-carboxyhexanoate--CoA ligase n=1 Tax=Leptospirillum ferriphilum TaxID=178606 RepID=A0A7C3QQS6_9BACT